MAIERRTLEVDPIANTREDFHYDHNTGRVIITQTQETLPIEEACKRAFNDAGDLRTAWRSKRAEWPTVAKLPIEMIPHLQRIGIIDKQYRVLDEPRLVAWLSEHSNFKTMPGRF